MLTPDMRSGHSIHHWPGREDGGCMYEDMATMETCICTENPEGQRNPKSVAVRRCSRAVVVCSFSLEIELADGVVSVARKCGRGPKETLSPSGENVKRRGTSRRETDLLSGKARDCAVAVTVDSCCQCRKCNFRCNSNNRSGKRACRVNNAALCTYILLSIYSVGYKCKRVWVQREPAAKTTEKRSKKK